MSCFCFYFYLSFCFTNCFQLKRRFIFDREVSQSEAPSQTNYLFSFQRGLQRPRPGGPDVRQEEAVGAAQADAAALHLRRIHDLLHREIISGKLVISYTMSISCQSIIASKLVISCAIVISCHSIISGKLVISCRLVISGQSVELSILNVRFC